MAKFNGYVITEAGRNLIAKGLTGDTITFTKMQLGDGTTSNDGRTMTALVSTKADLPIIGLSNTGTGIAELRFLINNKDITTGFYIKEVGVFAKGSDGVEVLYAYNVSPNPDFIPPFSANNIIEIEYVDSIIVDQVANITASIDPSITYMTQAQISSTYVKKTDIATQTEVDNGLEDTKIVTSKKLKARLDSMLASITTNFVKLTQLATENIAGIIKISSTAQVSAGTDNTTAVSPAKLSEAFANSKVRNGYQKLANGTIIQWGAAVYTAPGNATGNFSSITNNFPITFPNKVLSIVFTGFFDAGVAGDDGLECLHSVEWSSNSAFTFRATRLVGSTVPGHQGSAYYIAIGY